MLLHYHKWTVTTNNAYLCESLNDESEQQVDKHPGVTQDKHKKHDGHYT